MRDDEANLQAALRMIRDLVPTATTALFQTSDQDSYGFGLDDVILSDGTSLEEANFELFDAAKDAVDQYLDDLSWNGVMVEDRTGAAAIAIPEASWFRQQDAARSATLARIPNLTGPLAQLLPTADNRPEERWGGRSLVDLRDENWDGDGRYRVAMDAGATQHNNTRRAGFALVALAAYCHRIGADEKTALSDLFADLRHLCDALGEDFDALRQRSETIYTGHLRGQL